MLAQDLSEVIAVDMQVALEFDSHKKASASDILKEALVQFLKFLLEKSTLFCRVLHHTLLYYNADCSFGDSHS